MKTKQFKEESDKSIDDEAAVEPKTRARKKASDNTEDDKNKLAQEEPKTSKEPKRAVGKPRAIAKKQPLGIRKTTRSKTTAIIKAKAKKVIKQTATRGRKPAIKAEPESAVEKETVPLIPVGEIKKEPVDETASNQPNSRSSSPRTASRRQRLSSDVVMMKSVLADPPSNLVVGPRTSPYAMRSERSNSPSLFDGLRSGKPRKVKSNLLNEVVMKEQKKRRRLLSDSKSSESPEGNDECKKLKRGRSCSRDGSEISKCSDITESDLSMSESLNDVDSKELNKKLDKPKTDLDIDIENNIQISSIEKVPSLNIDSKSAETEPAMEHSNCNSDKNKNKLSLKRSTSLDSDNNNSNRLKVESLITSDVEDKSLVKTENDTLFEARSILTSMSKTFNSKGTTKNIRRARRGRKAATSTKPAPSITAKTVTSTTLTESAEDKQETIELNKKIDDIINNLGQNIDNDHELTNESKLEISADEVLIKTHSKISKPLGDNNSIVSPETPIKDKDILNASNEITPSKTDDSENIRLHYEEDSVDQSTDGSKQDKPFKCNTVASIDLLMDRLKEFEEFDKRRQRQESESKSSDSKSVMVSNDVVLIQKSGPDIKLKDIQAVKSPERPLEKENVLSCFENNSAISIVKRDHARKSIDIDLPNSVTLIKRNSLSARKESTSSNHSKESDPISIFEKSLGKDVTLTEIRKSVEKQPSSAVDIHQFATLHPNSPQLGGVVLDPHQISITTRVSTDAKLNSETKLTKRRSRESLSRKSSESGTEVEEKMATIEKIKSPTHQVLSPAVSITATPVAVKSPESVQPMEAEVLAAPLDTIKALPNDISLTTEVSIIAEGSHSTEAKPEPSESEAKAKIKISEIKETKKMEIDEKVKEISNDSKVEKSIEEKVKEISNDSKVEKSIEGKKEADKLKGKKSARNSIENQPGPSNAFAETPETQKRKENVLRTLGLLTHKAANEAKIEKLKEKERIYNGLMTKVKSGDYTGTLKTVIKLNRGTGERDKKRQRSSLKMTFQKSKHRGKPAPEQGEDNKDDDAYYTIERREGPVGVSSDGGHRKSHYSNRLNTHDPETAPEPAEPKETLNLVIPEKASSFSIHPGRLCMDQCFYCGGKFGLFDTPCHIAQIKSSERQKKVLDNEEKLTIDSCLCDACYRHVDRRANCPSYRKKMPGKPVSTDPLLPSPPLNISQSDKPISPPLDEESEEDASLTLTGRPAVCHAEGCMAPGDHSIRRKWLMKMRTSVNKLVRLQGDYPGLHSIPLCAPHHAQLAGLCACRLCGRRLTRHHNVHSLQNVEELNPLLKQQGIPLQFTERLILCKTCREYCSYLTRPGLNDVMVRTHTRKLLQICNVEVPPESEPEPEGAGSLVIDEANFSEAKQKKKTKTKNKQRKSTDPERPGDSESSEKTESSPEKHRGHDATPVEEDIESLISSNKIPVPGAKMSDIQQSDSSEDVYDFDIPSMAVDKQTQLQYLLQKQNNPAQFLKNQPNLTVKQKTYNKVQNAIQKPGQVQRIYDKNAKRIQKVGQLMMQKEKPTPELEIFDPDSKDQSKEGITIYKNISLNEECTIESIPNKRPADIATLKNKWQMSESFSQVKKNLSELSKKFTVEKDPKKGGEPKYSNPVKRLETNPSISVRELFPGEEEMNLQCNIEFNSVKGVTPEGWEKCNTTIQYDVDTKKLWTELQRPYGNQSSFLRHLILLEKYFRNGDLVLAQNATTHATVYSESVQTRLHSYDNVPTEQPKRSESSLIEFRKKPSVNGKSLLKTNQNDDKAEKDTKKVMPPPASVVTKKHKDKSKPKTLPPELIAINTPSNKSIQNVLHNIQQLVKGVSASDPTEVAAAPLPHPPKESQKEKKEVPKDTPKKQKPTSKPWRPTLMPITQENIDRIAREPTQVAVDGRHLPSLVQVMSSGKRYHITLQDYNKMCIMRREKLQQLQDGDKNKKTDENTIITEIQPSTMLGNGGTLVQTMNIPHEKETEKKEMPELSHISANAANILKTVGLKNITIAPILPKTATVTSQTISSPVMTSPSLMFTSTPMKLPQLGPSVSITSETVLTPTQPIMSTTMVMPKIPKSLTVIPQTVVTTVPNIVIPQNVVFPQNVIMSQNVVTQNVVTPTSAPVVIQGTEVLRP